MPESGPDYQFILQAQQEKQQEQQEPKPLKQELQELLAAESAVAQQSPDRWHQQQDLLGQLPDDLWMKIKGHVLGEDYRQAFFKKSPSEAMQAKGEASASFQEIMHLIKGQLFEELVRCDKTILQRPETPLAQQLRDFLDNPSRFGLPKEHRFHVWLQSHTQRTSQWLRNPDLAYLDEDGHIQGWGECKTGYIDDRALKQMDNDGFEASFRFFLDYVKSLPDDILKQHGLGVFAQMDTEGKSNKQRLSLAPTLTRKIIRPYIPQDKRKYVNFFHSSVSPEQKNTFEQKIKLGYYQMVYSPFGHDELKLMAEYLTKKLAQEQKIQLASSS